MINILAVILVAVAVSLFCYQVVLNRRFRKIHAEYERLAKEELDWYSTRGW